MPSWGWPTLLFAALVNQLPLLSALVPTEPVYVYLGTQLPGSGWWPLGACVLGAWLGSQASFWLGRTAGAAVVARMKVGQAAMARSRRLFDRWGVGFLIAGQLVWPVATLSQVMSGVWGMRPLTYVVASGVGVSLAIAMYAFVGWTAAAGLAALGLAPQESLLAWLGPYWVLIGFLVLLALGAALILWHGRGPLVLRGLYVALLAVAMLLAVNVGALTGRTGAAAARAPIPLATACRAVSETLVARTGETPLDSAQPVNLVLVGIDDPGAVMAGLGWVRNRTYAGAPLDAGEVVALTLRGAPPATTILLEGAASDLAWQRGPGILDRTQLRLWPVAVPEGAPTVFLGSAVHIESLALRLSGRVPTLAYGLEPGTDATRDAVAPLLAASILGAELGWVGGAAPPAAAPPGADGDPFATAALAVGDEFYSDGATAEVRGPGAPSLEALCSRLGPRPAGEAAPD